MDYEEFKNLPPEKQTPEICRGSGEAEWGGVEVDKNSNSGNLHGGGSAEWVRVGACKNSNSRTLHGSGSAEWVCVEVGKNANP